jgi:hypothetical protein
MKRILLAVAVTLSCLTPLEARGIVIPVDKSVPPLAMLNHRVNVTIEDQVAITHLEQTFRNHTSRQLEATYVFPVPKGASVREFAMWVDGKRVKGELLEAAQARQIYTDIVRRTGDRQAVQDQVSRTESHRRERRGPQRGTFFSALCVLCGDVFYLELSVMSVFPTSSDHTP